jgi:histidinol dehydrogenase
MTAIDSPAGPSELLIVADATANPAIVARELLAQAEHDPLTSVLAITDDESLVRAIERAIRTMLPTLPRSDIVGQALRARAALLWSDSLDEAVSFAARYAPEHLMLAGVKAEALLRDIRNAGTIFVGESSSVAFGDYMTGANHVLPTGGAARSYSGLSTSDFVRWTTYQRVDPDAASAMANDVAALAEAEDLAGHAAAARAWILVPDKLP